MEYYGAFSPGGYGDGYHTDFNLQPSIEDVLRWMNSPAMLSSLPHGKDKGTYFLGKVVQMDLFSEDRQNHISQRFKVLGWWSLDWDGKKWEWGSQLAVYPESIGLSPFE